MCIGMKPVFLPPSAVTLNSDINKKKVPSMVAASSSSSSSHFNRRKRSLNDDDNDRIETTKTSSSNKFMRYSTCTCQCDEKTTCLAMSPDTCVNNQNSKKRRPRSNSINTNRKVRFGGFKTFVPSKFSFTEDESKELWYGLDECAQMNEASKASVRIFREQDQHKDTLRHVLCVASQCSYSPPPLAYLQAVRLDLPYDARGLELGLLPIRTRQRRQEHVRKVVQVQNQIVAGKIPIKNDEQIKAKALAIQSMRSSQASQLFAQLLARNVAQDEIQNTEVPL